MKTVLITGAYGGMGRATALLLKKQGFLSTEKTAANVFSRHSRQSLQGAMCSSLSAFFQRINPRSPSVSGRRRMAALSARM